MSGHENHVFGPLYVKMSAIKLYVVECPIIFFGAFDHDLMVHADRFDHWRLAAVLEQGRHVDTDA